jgi:hypothetical protein
VLATFGGVAAGGFLRELLATLSFLPVSDDELAMQAPDSAFGHAR